MFSATTETICVSMCSVYLLNILSIIFINVRLKFVPNPLYLTVVILEWCLNIYSEPFNFLQWVCTFSAPFTVRYTDNELYKYFYKMFG